MSNLQPVKTQSNPGISPHQAVDQHTHATFDNGTELSVASGYANVYSDKPLNLYVAADWVFLSGIVRRTGASAPGNSTITIIPDRWLPTDPLDRTAINPSHLDFCPIFNVPSGGYYHETFEIVGGTGILRVFAAVNDKTFYFANEWRIL